MKYITNLSCRFNQISILFCLIIILSIFSLQGQTGILKGKITNQNKEVLSYASVFIKKIGVGSVSSIDGNYAIKIPYGENEIEFSILGYKRQRIFIEIEKDTSILNISLDKETYILPEIVVGLNEDPAFEMIRQAIKAREKNLLASGTFEANIYSKGIYKLEHVSDSALGKALFDSTHTKEEALGIIYLSEAESKFSLKYPNKIKEEIVSSKVSGDSKGFSFNFSSFININLYRNLVVIPFDMSYRGFVSPISSSAMMYYRYRLVGSFIDGDFLVHKIELRPKRKIDRIFHGYFYLVEGLWCIHSADLIITEDAEIDFIDSIRINQEFHAANDSMWALQTQNYNFDFSFNLFGIEAEFNGHYLTIFNEYNWEPNFGKNFFDDELLKIDFESNKKDSSYWDKNRPVPLSEEEIENYIEFDSVEQRISSKEYLDSIDMKNNKFKIWNYLRKKYTYRDRYHKWKLAIGSPIQDVAFNTVQGVRLKIPLNFKQEFEKEEFYKHDFDFSYGFSNKLFGFNSFSEYFYERNSFAKLKLNFGISHIQFDNSEPISPTLNALYSLFAEQNFMKLYRKKYINIGHESEIINGFFLSGNIEFSDRKALENTNSFTFRNVPDRSYTQNAPWEDVYFDADFINHQAFLINISANYTIKQKFASLPYKTRLGSRFPPIGISYTKAFSGFLGSDANFDFIKIYSNYSKMFGLFGQSRIRITYGKFLNSEKLYFSDYFHFRGNKTIFHMEGKNSFHLLDYYKYSTNNEYIEAHYQHHFNGFIINKIPWVRKSKFRMLAGAHYLYENIDTQYLELNIGIKNIFKFGRIDFVAAFEHNKILSTGITLGFGM